MITSPSGGVPGVDVTSYSLLQTQKPSLNVKIAGVSLISNSEYNDGSLKVWKAYGIGTGKCIRLSELNTPQVVQVPDLVKCDKERMPNAHFIEVKSRPQSRTTANSQRCSDTEEENVSKIFLLTVPPGSLETRTCFRE